MNLADLRDQLEFILSNNDAQDDTEYTSTRLDKAINWAYENVWNEIRATIGRANQIASYDIEWPSGDVNFTLPEALQGKALYAFYDMTQGYPGYKMTLQFESRNVLRWLPTGPGADTDIRVYYKADVEVLADDSDVPTLIPPAHHQLISYDAAIQLTQIADREVPRSWEAKHQKLMLLATKELATRPLSDRSAILPLDLTQDSWISSG